MFIIWILFIYLFLAQDKLCLTTLKEKKKMRYKYNPEERLQARTNASRTNNGG
jgi:YD repeat-containing protein